MVEAPKDYVVVTIAAGITVHAYGPYTRNEATRLANRLEFNMNGMYSFARKLQLKNEVTAKPNTPRG